MCIGSHRSGRVPYVPPSPESQASRSVVASEPYPGLDQYPIRRWIDAQARLSVVLPLRSAPVSLIVTAPVGRSLRFTMKRLVHGPPLQTTLGRHGRWWHVSLGAFVCGPSVSEDR